MCKVGCFGCTENISLAEYKSVLEFPNSFGNSFNISCRVMDGPDKVIRLDSFYSVIYIFSRRVLVYHSFPLISTLREVNITPSIELN